MKTSTTIKSGAAAPARLPVKPLRPDMAAPRSISVGRRTSSRLLGALAFLLSLSLGAASEGLQDPSYSSPGVTLEDLAFGDGLWVIVGTGGTIWHSADGESWEASPPATDVHLRGVTFSQLHHLFVAVGDDCTILTSSNGTDWEEQFASHSRSLMSVTSGREMLVAVGSGGTILTSLNGLCWEELAFGELDELRKVCFALDRFVAVGSRQTILTSSDGRHWARTTTHSSVSLRAVGAAPDGFIAIGCGRVFASSDGWTWRQTASIPVGTVLDLAFGNARWVAVGRDGLILTSKDGEGWIALRRAVNCHLQGINYDQGKFISVGSAGRQLSSIDGAIWAAANRPGDFDLHP